MPNAQQYLAEVAQINHSFAEKMLSDPPAAAAALADALPGECP